MVPTAPTRVRVMPGLPGRHAYFERLRRMPECAFAYAMRSNEELSTIDTGAVGPIKLPVRYDPEMDASLFRMIASVTCDSQQKVPIVGIGRGSMFITWDFRFNDAFNWQEGYLPRHKTWRFDGPSGGFWIGFKTDYQNAAGIEGGRPRRGVAEFMMTTQGVGALGPGTSREGETIVPRLTKVYFEADRWTRVFVFIEGIGEEVGHLSLWLADEERDAIHVYDRIAIRAAEDCPRKLRFEYDTSAGTKANPNELKSWNRNVVVLKDLSLARVRELLERPRR